MANRFGKLGYEGNIKAAHEVGPGEMEVSSPMDETWQRDGNIQDKILELCIPSGNPTRKIVC